MNSKLTLSVILPTLNEGENLKILIPDIQQKLNSVDGLKYEIIVADDGSTDATEEFINKKVFKNNVKLLKRQDKPSLPMSIFDGIDYSETTHVCWLDADGSMPAEVLKEMVILQMENHEDVIIGSRFVDGGGYKGIKQLGKTSVISAITNVYKSNDSVLGMIFSTLFNILLKFILNSEIKDITSGFIIGKKEYFVKEIFSIADYGDYFIYLVHELKKQNLKIIEHGYICETRIHGTSKTSTNVLQLLIRGIPYVKAAFKSRKGLV